MRICTYLPLPRPRHNRRTCNTHTSGPHRERRTGRDRRTRKTGRAEFTTRPHRETDCRCRLAARSLFLRELTRDIGIKFDIKTTKKKRKKLRALTFSYSAYNDIIIILYHILYIYIYGAKFISWDAPRNVRETWRNIFFRVWEKKNSGRCDVHFSA